MACVWKVFLLNIFIVSGRSNVLTGMSPKVLRVRFNTALILSDRLFVEEQSFQQCFTIMSLFEHEIMLCF